MEAQLRAILPPRISLHWGTNTPKESKPTWSQSISRKWQSWVPMRKKRDSTTKAIRMQILVPMPNFFLFRNHPFSFFVLKCMLKRSPLSFRQVSWAPTDKCPAVLPIRPFLHDASSQNKCTLKIHKNLLLYWDINTLCSPHAFAQNTRIYHTP